MLVHTHGSLHGQHERLLQRLVSVFGQPNHYLQRRLGALLPPWLIERHQQSSPPRLEQELSRQISSTAIQQTPKSRSQDEGFYVDFAILKKRFQFPFTTRTLAGVYRFNDAALKTWSKLVSTSEHYDVLVVGRSVSGLITAALLAKRRFRVRVID